jgi:hypothetical protein
MQRKKGKGGRRRRTGGGVVGSALRRPPLSSHSQCRLRADISHLEHDPDAALGGTRRVLNRADVLSRVARGGEGAAVREGRDCDGEPDIDKPPRRGGVGRAGLKRARRARPRAGASVAEDAAIARSCARHHLEEARTRGERNGT